MKITSIIPLALSLGFMPGLPTKAMAEALAEPVPALAPEKISAPETVPMLFPLRTDVWRRDKAKPTEIPTVPNLVERTSVEKPAELPRGFYEAKLSFIIETDGTIHEAVITVPSGSSELDAALLTMIKQWKFEPAKLDGNPVAVVSSVPMKVTQKRGKKS